MTVQGSNKYYRAASLEWPLTPDQLRSIDSEIDTIYRALNATQTTLDGALGVVAGTYGDATDIPQLTVNVQGLVTSIVNIPIGSALTAVNDTNVTVTLGGTPATSLVRAVSLTLGWTGQLGLSRGGSAADLSGTGGSKQYVKQATLGGAFTVGTIPASDIVSGAALTRVNDANVTLTLGGTPTTALLVAASITAGWTGQLGLSRGGTNADLSATGGASQVLQQSGVGAVVTVGQLAASDLTNGVTGSGAVVLATSPALLTNPTAPTQATTDNSTRLATTAYVTTAVANAIAGVNPAVAVQAASAAKLPNAPTYLNGVGGIGATITAGVTNTTLVVDGYTPVLNDRILVKNEGDAGGIGAAKNGVYFVSQLAALGLAWVLTRALDYDQPSDINNTGAIPVVNGTANTNTSWLLTSLVTTVGTDALTYVQFSVNPSTLVTGSGTTGKLPKWTTGASRVLGDSVVTEASGQIGVGGSPTSDWANTTLLQATGSAFGTASIASTRADGAGLRIGSLTFENLTNTATFRTQAVIESYTPVSGTANKRGGEIAFLTQPDNTAGPAERMRIFSTGGVAIGLTTDPGASNVALKGKVTTYANVATVGWGVPAIYASGHLAGITTNALQTICTYTPTADGDFLIPGTCTLNSGAVTVTVSVNYTSADSGNNNTLTICAGSSSGFSFGGAQYIRAKASTVITVESSTGGTPINYGASGSIIQIA